MEEESSTQAADACLSELGRALWECVKTSVMVGFECEEDRGAPTCETFRVSFESGRHLKTRDSKASRVLPRDRSRLERWQTCRATSRQESMSIVVCQMRRNGSQWHAP